MKILGSILESKIEILENDSELLWSDANCMSTTSRGLNLSFGLISANENFSRLKINNTDDIVIKVIILSLFK